MSASRAGDGSENVIVKKHMPKSAGIIVIGNEILSGKTQDENALFLARELRALGVDLQKIAVIPDDLGLISREVRLFSSLFDYVFTTGGVGPTHDDLTMDAIAAAFEQKIRRHPELESTLRSYYSEALIEANLRMADIPEGARLVGGRGMWFPVIAIENVFIFPGVPEILKRKFERIKEMFGKRRITCAKSFSVRMKGRSRGYCTNCSPSTRNSCWVHIRISIIPVTL